MTIEQLITEAQKLIGRGTISPSAEIELWIRDPRYNEYNDNDLVEIGVHESSYNKFILFAK